MRLASWNWGGRPHAGVVSPDGTDVTPLAVADPARVEVDGIGAIENRFVEH